MTRTLLSTAMFGFSLLSALAFPQPTRGVRGLVRSALRARGRVVRFLPPRTGPYFARQQPQVRSYPDGYAVAELGTFPSGCPVPRPREAEPAREEATSRGPHSK